MKTSSNKAHAYALYLVIKIMSGGHFSNGTRYGATQVKAFVEN